LELAQKHHFELIAYPNAYHSFDHPHLKIRERTAAFTTRGDGMVTIGTNLEARADSIRRVVDLFKE
jgi:dienelactone hydrolase